ncbi:hypothetical protein CYMTET_53227 [Cymbomonas tetramitiformis]|uniref:Transposase n=1 Tax=Cymbomonas tetramitiformis TaxID=36881 RepID=A0AAE0BIH8_9CHLO|nr:hypothetical protein CYMTET_53227 [Cymbomonas tetramitiformis]
MTLIKLMSLALLRQFQLTLSREFASHLVCGTFSTLALGVLSSQQLNDSRSAVTGFTPFELTYGHAPASQLDFFVEAALASRRGRAKGGRGAAVKKGTAHETARQFVRQLQLAREKLLLAQQQQIAQYDARHKARSYAVGDEVWVDATYLTQPGDRGLHKKLLKKRLGPLRVLEVFHSGRQMALPASDRGAPSAYRLQTPKQWKVHDVFTVNRLSPVESSSVPLCRES